jgi:hypothetical protein
MSLAELKKECSALSPEEQCELAAFLAVVRMKQSGEGDGLDTAPIGVATILNILATGDRRYLRNRCPDRVGGI